MTWMPYGTRGCRCQGEEKSRSFSPPHPLCEKGKRSRRVACITCRVILIRSEAKGRTYALPGQLHRSSAAKNAAQDDNAKVSAVLTRSHPHPAETDAVQTT